LLSSSSSSSLLSEVVVKINESHESILIKLPGQRKILKPVEFMGTVRFSDTNAWRSRRRRQNKKVVRTDRGGGRRKGKGMEVEK
jgi:hypothetical protein